MTFLQILFWLLVVLWAAGLVVPPSGNLGRAHGAIPLILFAILGFYVFGNPIHK